MLDRSRLPLCLSDYLIFILFRWPVMELLPSAGKLNFPMGECYLARVLKNQSAMVDSMTLHLVAYLKAGGTLQIDSWYTKCVHSYVNSLEMGFLQSDLYWY